MLIIITVMIIIIFINQIRLRCSRNNIKIKLYFLKNIWPSGLS